MGVHYGYGYGWQTNVNEMNSLRLLVFFAAAEVLVLVFVFCQFSHFSDDVHCRFLPNVSLWLRGRSPLLLLLTIRTMAATTTAPSSPSITNHQHTNILLSLARPRHLSR